MFAKTREAKILLFKTYVSKFKLPGDKFNDRFLKFLELGYPTPDKILDSEACNPDALCSSHWCAYFLVLSGVGDKIQED